jgi:hypothetical protein
MTDYIETGVITDNDVDTEAAGERLEERLARGAMSFDEALQSATQLAAQLRDLHASGLEYGALSAATVTMGACGAGLAHRNSLARKADGRGDVTAFGELMELMLDGAETPERLLEFWAETAGLADRCRTQAPEMQQVLIQLRLLGMRARMALPAPRVDPTASEGLVARLKSFVLLAATALLGSNPVR